MPGTAVSQRRAARKRILAAYKGKLRNATKLKGKK